MYYILERDKSLLNDWHEYFTREPHAPIHAIVCRVYKILHALLTEGECVLFPQEYFNFK